MWNKMYDQLLNDIENFIENGSTDDIINVENSFNGLNDSEKQLLITIFEKFKQNIADNDYTKARRIDVLFRNLKAEMSIY